MMAEEAAEEEAAGWSKKHKKGTHGNVGNDKHEDLSRCNMVIFHSYVQFPAGLRQLKMAKDNRKGSKQAILPL